MSFIAKNPLSLPEIKRNPHPPATGTRGIFAKEDGWYDINSVGEIKKIGSAARSADYYIGSWNTPSNDGCDFICENIEGKRFNDIIKSIMDDIESNTSKEGSKIIVKNGTYYQDGDIVINQKCIMDFEKEFDISSEGSGYKWDIRASYGIFNNFKVYSDVYIYGAHNIFTGCCFAKKTNIGGNFATNITKDNCFRFCVFNDEVQNGYASASEKNTTADRTVFNGCQFDKKLMLACEEVIVKNCHFSSPDHGIEFNGRFPQNLLGHFSGNSMCAGEAYGVPLYDEITSKYVAVDIVCSKEEFDDCVVDGIYKVIYQDNPCFGIISSNKENNLQWHTIWAPHLFAMLTRTIRYDSKEVISDYKNLFIASKCVQSVTIKGGSINWTKEAVKDTSGNTVGYRYGQVVEVENATITSNSKVDLQLSSEQAVIFQNESLAFVAENDEGKVTIYCIGAIPKNNHTIQVTVTEVS